MERLAIIKITDDKGAESYLKALKRELKDNIVLFDNPSTIVEDLQEFFTESPLSQYLVLEPCSDIIKKRLDCIFGPDIEGIRRYPITATAIFLNLKEMTNLKFRTVCILNSSNRIGKPLANMLIDAGATVTICNSRTRNDNRVTALQNADIVITATNGKYHYHPMPNQIIIDCSGDITYKWKDRTNYINQSEVGKWTIKELIRRLEQ